VNETKTLLEQAKTLYKEGKWAESEAAYERLIASGSDVVEGFYGVGLVRGSMHDWDAAFASFENALLHDPRHANAFYQLGFLTEQRGDLQEATKYYREALSVNPQHRGAQTRLGRLSLRREPGRSPWRSSTLWRPTPAGDAVVGVVRGLRIRSEPDYPYSFFPWQIWTFSVEREDEAGNRLPPVLVEMRGHEFRGNIEEGDTVEVSGTSRAGEIKHAKEVHNLTKNATVRATERRASRIQRMFSSHVMWVLMGVFRVAGGTFRVAGGIIRLVFGVAVFALFLYLMWWGLRFSCYNFPGIGPAVPLCEFLFYY
jgi:tetratricopeptide repeat protein